MAAIKIQVDGIDTTTTDNEGKYDVNLSDMASSIITARSEHYEFDTINFHLNSESDNNELAHIDDQLPVLAANGTSVCGKIYLFNETGDYFE